MSLFVIPVGLDGECCDCDFAVDPCTCCSPDLGSDDYYEYHGSGECPDISEPCGDAEFPSCANIKIGPVRLNSVRFKTKCLDKFNIKAYVALNVDNYGSIYGPSGSVDFNEGICGIGSNSGVIVPYVENIGNGNSKAYVFATAQNSAAGGPYGLSASAQFYFELPA
jgi:hypothetical protein